MAKIYEADTFRNLTDTTYKTPFVKTFTDVVVSNWIADSTYLGYGYKCEIATSGVTNTMTAFVTFGHTESISGNYSPVCLTNTDSVTIYSKVNTSITIPRITVLK